MLSQEFYRHSLTRHSALFYSFVITCWGYVTVTQFSNQKPNGWVIIHTMYKLHSVCDIMTPSTKLIQWKAYYEDTQTLNIIKPCLTMIEKL